METSPFSSPERSFPCVFLPPSGFLSPLFDFFFLSQVDGVFLRGHAVKCDESGATGESDAIKKVSYEDCLAERAEAEGTERTQDQMERGFKNDCFLVSGGKVLEGVGEYVVIAVGPNSFNGRTMMGESATCFAFVI